MNCRTCGYRVATPTTQPANAAGVACPDSISRGGYGYTREHDPDAVPRGDRDDAVEMLLIDDRPWIARLPADADHGLLQPDARHRGVERLAAVRRVLRAVVVDAELGREHPRSCRERADEHARKCSETPHEAPHFAPAPAVPRGGRRAGCSRASEDRVEQPTSAEPHRIVGRQAALVLGRRDRCARRLVVEPVRVDGQAGDAGGSRGQRDALVELDELGERGQRVAGVVVDLGRAGTVAQDVGVWGGAVEQAEGDAGVRRMDERALALDEQELAPALDAFDDQPLCRTCDEIGHDGVDRDPPSCDRHPGLPGRDEHGAQPTCARLTVELERDGHLSDRAVRPHREHDLRRHLEVRTGGNAQVGRRAA